MQSFGVKTTASVLHARTPVNLCFVGQDVLDKARGLECLVQRGLNPVLLTVCAGKD